MTAMPSTALVSLVIPRAKRIVSSASLSFYASGESSSSSVLSPNYAGRLAVSPS